METYEEFKEMTYEEFKEMTYEEFKERMYVSTCEFCQAMKSERSLDKSKHETFCQSHSRIYENYRLNQNIVTIATTAQGYPSE